jgi:hypothetical protein
MIDSRITPLLLIVLLVTSAVAAAPAVAQGGETKTCEPELSVTYDDFRLDEEVVQEFNDSNSAAVIRSNTRATVEESDAFARVKLENPNSYCVEFEVQMSEDVVKPATLGKVSAVEKDLRADWEATHDFQRDETYTRVSVIVPAETTVQFAPSQLRIESLSWTGRAEEHAGSITDQVSERLGLNDDLEKRHYELSGNQSEMITIDLTHPETGEPIKDWHATYKIAGQKKKPLDEGTGEPVFYRELTNEDGQVTAIQVTFNKAGTVNFVAEPTTGDKVSYDVTSYLSSLRETTNWSFPFTIMPPTDYLPIASEVTAT